MEKKIKRGSTKIIKMFAQIEKKQIVQKHMN